LNERLDWVAVRFWTHHLGVRGREIHSAKAAAACRCVSTLGQQIRYARELSRIAELAQHNGAADDPLIRERLTRAWVGLRAMRSYALATMDVEQPGQDNVSKLLWASWHRDLGELAMDVMGTAARGCRGSELDGAFVPGAIAGDRYTGEMMRLSAQ
jgi:alkylation response protein AidB-like acyl-CoA dehydrogenase